MLAPLLAGCAGAGWEKVAELDPMVALLQESAPESATELTLTLAPEIDGRDGKAGTLFLQLELDATLTTVDGSRPVTSLLVFAEDPDEPVPQEARGTPTDEGVPLYRVGYRHPCSPREDECTVRYTVLFHQLGAGSVQVEWSARAIATGSEAAEVMSEETVLSITAAEATL